MAGLFDTSKPEIKLSTFTPPKPRKPREVKPKEILEVKARKIGGEEAECYKTGRPFIPENIKGSKPKIGSIVWINGTYYKYDINLRLIKEKENVKPC